MYIWLHNKLQKLFSIRFYLKAATEIIKIRQKKINNVCEEPAAISFAAYC